MNGWMTVSLKVARILTVCVAIMLLLNAWGLFDFWNWLHNGGGSRDILLFSRRGWTLLASLIENRLVSDVHGRPLRPPLLTLCHALAVISPICLSS
ncbi:hypothetical protein T636_A1478 [Enterobacter hormaechei subsp. xiangfangensis]|nr:hypothetical protein T636_A1478 [Enterobacter hormaechei subsp. xiangfangensis]